jgi:hypothetical protein
MKLTQTDSSSETRAIGICSTRFSTLPFQEPSLWANEPLRLLQKKDHEDDFKSILFLETSQLVSMSETMLTKPPGNNQIGRFRFVCHQPIA